MIQEGDSHQNHYDQQTSPNYGIALTPNTTIQPYSHDRFFITTARSCCTCPIAIYRLNAVTLNTIRLHSARLCETTYSSPVTLYPPLEPVSTVLTSAPRISSKLISTPVLQSLPHDVLLDLTSSTFTPAPLAQPPRDSTSLPSAYSSQFDLEEKTSPVLVPPERTLLPERQQTVTQTFPAVSETRTFTVQPSSVNFSSPEHYSRSASIFGNNRSTPSDQVLLAVALNGLKPSVKTIVMNKTPTNMAELRQAAVLAEKSIATTDTTDFSTLNTILNEVKQLKDEVKVANSKQTQDSISSIQTHAHVNVTKPPFRTPSSNYQTSGLSFRPNTTYTSAPPAFPKSYPSPNPPSQSFRGPRYQPQPQNGYLPLVLDAVNSVDHVDPVVHAMHSATTVTK
ncbi:hypothetical protein CHS0354_004695 [Potamilus streckersoni]|uniref:Uncharacterized protein n=1 Tax=Potamilus streckersoni TaxID=2493646 RepID=A0AAE0SHV6_9BIVA|nr:hypothetical protein CHS0354_004695 [Potamilus streckersoni]